MFMLNRAIHVTTRIPLKKRGEGQLRRFCEGVATTEHHTVPMYLEFSMALDPSLPCQCPHNRLDVYFCVGMLCKMLHSSILKNPTKERLTFYKLLSRGFYHVQTACDPAWFLLTTQEKHCPPLIFPQRWEPHPIRHHLRSNPHPL